MNQIDSKEIVDYFNSCSQLNFVKFYNQGLTELQHKEKIIILKKELFEEGVKFLKKDLIMEGLVLNISEQFIRVRRWNCWNEIIKVYPSCTEDFEYYMLNFLFSFQSETFRKELLTYNAGDFVKISGNIYYFINGGGGSEIGLQKAEYITYEYDKFNAKRFDNKGGYSDKYCVYLDLITIEKIPKPALDSNSKGCFIATAAFGHPDISEVIRLREFRDTILINSIVGRIFIQTYNILSPPVASIIKHSKFLRKSTRGFLRMCILPIINMTDSKDV